MDAVFDPRSFVNEAVWKRSAAHSDAAQGATHLGRTHDTLLVYQKGSAHAWHVQYVPFDPEYVRTHYRYIDEGTGRRFRKGDLTAAKPGGDTEYEWAGPDGRTVRPYKGRFWAYSKANMERFEREGRLVYTKTGMPEYKRYIDDQPGQALQDMWTDIPPINARAAERLGYPTQKPEALLERIIAVASSEDDVVLDPFCGCGTAIAAAQKLSRRWIGIDVTYLAIALIRRRLRDAYGESIDETYEVIGEPASVADAKVLAEADPYQFQWWALDQVHARGVERKKGADKGIDGRIYFHEGDSADVKQIIISVKAGKTQVPHVRDLRGVLDREEAVIGVLISMQAPTRPMREEAASAGFYNSPWGKHPKLQLLTVADILGGKGIDCPPLRHVSQTFKKAQRQQQRLEQASLGFAE